MPYVPHFVNRIHARRGSILVVVLLVMLIVSISTVALITAASAEGKLVVENEKDAKVSYIAQSGLTFGRYVLGLGSDVDDTWNGWLTTKVLMNAWYGPESRFQVYVTIMDNDDGDGDLTVDDDGTVLVTSAAYGPMGSRAAFTQSMRRQRFDQYLFAIGSGNLAAPAGFVASGPIYVNGELRVIGGPATFTSDVATVGGVKYMGSGDESTTVFGGVVEEGVTPIGFPEIGASQWSGMAADAAATGTYFNDGKDRFIHFYQAAVYIYTWDQSLSDWVFESSAWQKDVPVIYSATKVSSKGTLYLRGQVGGYASEKAPSQVTVVSEQDVYIFGNLTYTDPTQDALGIIAGNDVWLETRTATSNRGSSLTDDAIISASIYAVGTMRVTNAGASYEGFTFYGSLSLGYLQLGDTTGVEAIWGKKTGAQYFNFDTNLSKKKLKWMPKMALSAPKPFGVWMRHHPDDIPARPTIFALPLAYK